MASSAWPTLPTTATARANHPAEVTHSSQFKSLTSKSTIAAGTTSLTDVKNKILSKYGTDLTSQVQGL